MRRDRLRLIPRLQDRVIGRVAEPPLGGKAQEEGQPRMGVADSAWLHSDAGLGVWLSTGNQVVLANKMQIESVAQVMLRAWVSAEVPQSPGDSASHVTHPATRALPLNYGLGRGKQRQRALQCTPAEISEGQGSRGKGGARNHRWQEWLWNPSFNRSRGPRKSSG